MFLYRPSDTKKKLKHFNLIIYFVRLMKWLTICLMNPKEHPLKR